MRKVLLVIFIGIVWLIGLYGLHADLEETNGSNESVTVIYVE